MSNGHRLGIAAVLDRVARLWLPNSHQLDRPVFVVGCSKSGTTILGILLSYHPKVGPKNTHGNAYSSLQHFLNAMLVDKVFNDVAHEMEEKQLWDQYFPINDCALRTGKELILYDNPLAARTQREFIDRLRRRLNEPRYCSKQPFNTFRVHVLREMFPDAKIVAIHRDGRDVAASWGRKQNRWEKLGGYENAIGIFARKWNEAVDHLEEHRETLNIYTLRYEDLLPAPWQQLSRVFEFCELDCPAIYDGLQLRREIGLWRERIPQEYHDRLNRLTKKNRDRLGYTE